MRRQILLAATALALTPMAGAQFADSSRECAICHVAWMPTFLHARRDADLMDMPSEALVDTEDMCFSCHDGSVDDSRRRVFLEHGHQTGIALTDDMPIPEHLPLDEENRIRCSTCHSAHGTNPRAEGGRISFFMRMSNENSELCMTCHTSRHEHQGAVNHPVGVDVEGEWPRVITEALGERGTEGDVICQSCHTPHGSGENDLLVMPVGESELCVACHGDLMADDSESPWLASHPINLIPAAGTDMQPLVDHGGRLGEDQRVLCLSCHSTHAGVSDGGILVMDNRNDGLCLLCHDNKTGLDRTPHALASTAPDLMNDQGRPAASAGSCSGCHLPHGAMGPMLWARTPETGSSGEAALCLSCHSGAHGEDIPSLSDVNHPREIALPNDMSHGSLPLFDAALHPSDQGDLVCSTCHLVHEVRGDVEGAAATLRVENDEDQLCQICHGPEWSAVAGGGHDLAGVDDAAGLCSTCHVIHNGQGPHLWAQPLGEGQAVAEQMCGSCHGNPHWTTAPDSSSHLHPVAGDDVPSENLPLPLYRRGDAQRGEGTGMTCLTCHDAHHLPEGAAESTRLALGGDTPLCQSCHPEMATIAETPHGLQGRCTTCHRVTDDDGSGLHYRALSGIEEDGDTITSLCMGCHGQSHLMMEAHPLASAEDLETRPEHLPLFNSVGARDSDGHMSCATCHEPHGALGADPMLRPPMGDDPALCTECHRDQRAVGGTHHDMRTTAGEGATVCSACHTAHPREDLPLLWAGTLGEGADFVSRTCTGCHRASGPGRIVPPGTAVHPPNAVMFWTDDDTSGGAITCGTCHDVHHWSEDPGERDLQAEGNLFTSFLRRGVAADACAQCHGREAMVRHLLFHQGQRWGHSALIPQEASQ